MVNADLSGQQSAREKIAAQQSSVRRADLRKRALIAVGSVVVVIAVVVGFVVFKSLGKPSSGNPPTGPGAASSVSSTAASVTRAIASVPAATLDKVGAGVAYPATGSVYPHAVQTVTPAATPLTSGGKPEIVYVGAEYCPYCAAERWALAVALSRFGTFSGLRLIHSSSTDVYPNTPTISFYQASYASRYLVFTTTEAETVSDAPLQPLTALDRALMTKYDAPPYVPSSTYSRSFPFVDFANRYVIVGASYAPTLLAGLSWQQVAGDLTDPGSPAGAAIDAAANRITAAICKATGGKPGGVCTSSAVTSVSGSI